MNGFETLMLIIGLMALCFGAVELTDGIIKHSKGGKK